MWTRLILAAGMVSCVGAQRDPMELHACDEGYRRKTHLSTTDRRRMDVAMAATVEMYSWVGESRFHDNDLFDMVNEVAISTGSFAAFLTAIFRTEDANFTYNGERAARCPNSASVSRRKRVITTMARGFTG